MARLWSVPRFDHCSKAPPLHCGPRECRRVTYKRSVAWRKFAIAERRQAIRQVALHLCYEGRLEIARQDIDNHTSFCIYHHSSITLSLPPAPIVDAQNTNVAGAAGYALRQVPQEGVVACWHAETVIYQPLARLTSGAQIDKEAG
jgi:hypothetical protein